MFFLEDKLDFYIIIILKTNKKKKKWLWVALSNRLAHIVQNLTSMYSQELKVVLQIPLEALRCKLGYKVLLPRSVVPQMEFPMRPQIP